MLQNIFPIFDFLYILQLEEYETSRYVRTIKRLFLRRNLQKRGRLIWTKRIRITFYFALLPSIILFPLTPIWVALVNFIFSYYFESKKLNIQNRASEYFKEKGKNTKVIVVAGSYGKTTTKNYIQELIKYNYKTQMIPGNINTPTGIGNWILENFNPSTEILIVEVDTYYIGEIQRSLGITPPDIAVLTNIGDQHLERFGTQKNLKKALLEVFDYAKPDAIRISEKKSNLDYALEVAKILNIPNDIVKHTIKNLSKPDRRGDIKLMNGFEVIDESYNISFSTAKSTIETAVRIAKTKNKKLIVVTAGIPELGEENKDSNKKLGELLSQKADKIILLKSILYKEVINDSGKFVLANDLSDVWKILVDFNNKKYIVLLEPELNDLYY